MNDVQSGAPAQFPCRLTKVNAVIDKLKEDLKVAMRAKDKIRLGTIRMLMTEFQKKAKEKGQDGAVSEDEALQLLAREVKKRREAAEAYRNGDRDELAAKEDAEADIIGEYLPKALTEDEVKGLIADAIAAVNPEGMRDMGKVMGKIMPHIRGRFDGKAASALVRAAITAS